MTIDEMINLKVYKDRDDYIIALEKQLSECRILLTERFDYIRELKGVIKVMAKEL